MKTRIITLLAPVLLMSSLTAAEAKAEAAQASSPLDQLTNAQLAVGGALLFGANLLLIRFLTRKFKNPGAGDRRY